MALVSVQDTEEAAHRGSERRKERKGEERRNEMGRRREGRGGEVRGQEKRRERRATDIKIHKKRGMRSRKVMR